MNATAHSLPQTATNARDLLEETTAIIRALRDLCAPAATLADVDRDDLAGLYGFARRLPDTFPNLAAHAPDVFRLIGELLEPSADLGGVSRAALFSALDALAIVQFHALDALRAEDAAASLTTAPARTGEAAAPLRLVHSQERPQPRAARAAMTAAQLADWQQRLRAVMSHARPLPPFGKR
jgi:hypothetical protein